VKGGAPPYASKTKPKRQKLLAATSPQASRSLNIPAWVPKCISDLAQTMNSEIDDSADPAAFNILQQLTADQRMERVWREVFRPRKAGGFFNSAIPQASIFEANVFKAQRLEASRLRELGGKENLKTARRLERDCDYREFFSQYVRKLQHKQPLDSNQDWQRSCQKVHARALFRYAHMFAHHDTADLAATGAKLVPTMRGIAKLLKATAGLLRAMRQPEPDCRELERISAACANRELELFPEDLKVGTNIRNRGDARSRAYVLQLSEICRQLFGTPMMNTVATITNVALCSDDIGAARVRRILRSDSADMNVRSCRPALDIGKIVNLIKEWESTDAV
jgi:hypothetical protein